MEGAGTLLGRDGILCYRLKASSIHQGFECFHQLQLSWAWRSGPAGHHIEEKSGGWVGHQEW